jgi:catechol-2,3-dioxygenase
VNEVLGPEDLKAAWRLIVTQGVGVVGLYVRDQEEALKFYVDKLGFRVHTDVKNGDFRWLTVQHPTSRPSSSVCSSRNRR